MTGGSTVREARRDTRGADLLRASGRPAPGPEHLVASLHRSGRRLLMPALWFVVLCGATGFFWGRLPLAWENAAVPIVAAALAVLLSLAPLLVWLTGVTTITTRRIVVRRGFASRTEFLLGAGTDATLRRRPLQFIAGSGDVIVHAGGDGTLVLRDMPHAKLVLRTVLDLIEVAATTTGPVGVRGTGRR